MDESIKPSQVPVVILAGGLGTRLAEETTIRPKPMVEIGDIPILIHIMRWYYAHGFDDFVICTGYKSWTIKDYFVSYQFRQNHIVIDHRNGGRQDATWFGENLAQERWRVRVVETGNDAMTGARIATALDTLAQEDGGLPSHFALTYGDGVSDVNLNEQLAFHVEHGCVGTVMAVKPANRFGEMDFDPDGRVRSFLEKPESKKGHISAGFFFFRSALRDYLTTDQDSIFEREPLTKVAGDEQLMAYKYDGFWHPMDTLRDKLHLDHLWNNGKAPWEPSRAR